ncbi:TolC family protein [Thalassotalea profundi]
MKTLINSNLKSNVSIMFKNKVHIVAAVMLSALITGCASKINETQHQQLLESFIERADIASNLSGQDELNWWHRFNSAQLNQLVDAALAKNHDLKTSQLQLKSALARLGAQKTDYLPQGSISASANRSSLADAISKESTANIASDWQIDLFGRITALVDAANASAMSQAEQLRLLQVEVVSAIVKGYVNYQGNIKKEHIATKQIEALHQSIDVLQAQVDEGMANELDLNRTKAQLSQQQALLPEIKYAKYRDLSTLALLTGHFTNEIKVDENSEVLLSQIAVEIIDPNNAIALRPDILQALYKFSQANSLSVAANKALLPNISLSGFAGILGLNNTRLVDTQQQWQVNPQIEWSLLSYPALLAQKEAQEYLSEAAYSEYQKIVLKAMNESELSLQLLVKQNNQQSFAQERFKHANNAFYQAQAMYQEGQIPYLELLDARQDVLIAEKDNIDSSISSLIAKVSTYQAFNGRWSRQLTAEK